MLNPPPYKTFPLSSYEREMKRSMRAMRGFKDLELVIGIGKEERDFLYAYGKLPKNASTMRRNFSEVLLDILHMCMSLQKAPKEAQPE